MRKKGKKKEKKQLPITRLRININPIFITSRTASWTQFSASATSSRGIEHCSYTSSINQAARWNKWWARTNSTTAAATNSSVPPQNNSHTWCVQTSKSSCGGEEKKTTHLRKARTGADRLNTYYWRLLINSMSNYLIKRNCVSCMYKFCMQLLLLLLLLRLSSLEIGEKIT